MMLNEKPLIVPLFLILIISILAGGCAELPHIALISMDDYTEFNDICDLPFPKHPWRAVHAIHITGPFKQKNAVIGVTIVVPAERRIRAVIMTIEGLVLFDADHFQGITKHRRAIPPLDQPAFSDGLIQDVSMIFLPPEGTNHRIGRDSDGSLVCRWINQGKGTTDVVVYKNGERKILHYNPKDRLKREILLSPHQKNSLPRDVTFLCHGLGGYTLEMTLLEQEPLTAHESLFEP